MDFIAVCVVFVFHVANNGFKKVFNCDYACRSAVLVYNNGNLQFVGRHLRKQVGAELAFRHEIGKPHDVGQLYIRVNRRANIFKEIFHINNSEQVVEVIVVNRYARKSAPARKLHNVLNRGGVFDCLYFCAVRHYFAYGAVVEVEDI